MTNERIAVVAPGRLGWPVVDVGVVGAVREVGA
jgi:hypothetical protein